MKIAVISLNLPTQQPGGVPTQVHLLSNELARRGHAVTVFSLDPAPGDARYSVRQIILPAFLQPFMRHARGWGIYFFPWYVAKENFSEFDVIHAHGDSHFLRGKVPVVRTFHSAGLREALHPSRLRQVFGFLGIYPFEYLSALRATRCIFVGSSLERFYPGIRFQVIPNGVDLSRFKPAPEARAPEPTILFVAASMLGRKRGPLLLKVFRDQVLPALPLAKLWMVCREPVSGANVAGWGLRSPEALSELYPRAWIFCLPSAVETLSVAYIEALASGTPVVATPNDAARDVLENGTYGILTAPEKLGETLIALLSDERRRQELAAKGVERAKDYALDKIVDRYESLYAEVVGSRS